MKEQLTLGGLIAAMEKRPRDEEVRFVFGSFVARSLGSYRGYYDHLAIEYDDNWRKPETVAAWLEKLRGAIGETYSGYKGGDYVMSEATPMWASNYGNADHCAIVGIADCSYTTYIETAWCEW